MTTKVEKQTGIFLTPEDLKYLKILNLKTTEIKGFIGEMEITKAKLLGDFNQAANAEVEFINQLYAKYAIDDSKDFSIDKDTGAITIV